ncbi:MAG: hypothetical protein LBM92_00865 [Opitutaceae bacterium]|nr:hypothetical protein [Opitutaceae bacterium]
MKTPRKPANRQILALASLAFLIAAALLVLRFHAETISQPAAPQPVAARPAAREEPLASAEKTAASGDSAHPAAAALSPKTRAVLERIPARRLREEVLALAPDALARAIKALAAQSASALADPGLRVTRTGALYYVCVFPGETAATAQSGSGIPPPRAGAAILPPSSQTEWAWQPASRAAAAPVPIDRQPVRHSRPGSRNVLFLDFGGMDIHDTEWNEQYHRAHFQAKPYDTDGDTTTFSAAEQDAIIHIWERVAEDFAPFEVDVTTERPAVFTHTTGRALITAMKDRANVSMPGIEEGGSTAGIAFLNVFGEVNYAATYSVPGSHSSLPAASPALIYHDKLGNNAASIAFATSHELGHHLGLHHDGPGQGTITGSGEDSDFGYYGGHGSGAISWSPIMGNGYSRSVGQWSKGEYRNANNLEDDLAISAGKIGYRGETASTSFDDADALTSGTDGCLGAEGVLLHTGDAHFHSVNLGSPGNISFTLAPFAPSDGTTANGGNTDLRLELLDATGTVIASDNPANATNASLNRNLAAGQWLLRVTSTGAGNPLASSPTGYTDYGSIGQYTLATNLLPSAPALDVALAASATAPRLWWFTGGDTSWHGQSGVTHDGINAATSGTIPAGQSSNLYTIVEGSGTLSFWWKTTAATSATLSLAHIDYGEGITARDVIVAIFTATLSGGGDHSTVNWGAGSLINTGTTRTSGAAADSASSGVILDAITGETDWRQCTAVITGAGAHALEWTYKKDAASAGAGTAYLDQVNWQPTQAILAGIPAGRTAASGTGAFTLDIETNTAWIAITDAPGWLLVSPFMGAGPATLAISHVANPAPFARRGTVSIVGGGLVRSTVVTQSFDIPLATALDNNFTWQTGGTGAHAAWFGQKQTSHDGLHAARSGITHGDSESWMQTTVSGTGVVGFWWKVSSEQEDTDPGEEALDGLYFYVDGQERARISGAETWAANTAANAGWRLFVDDAEQTPPPAAGEGWDHREFAITTPGEHTLKWAYQKDFFWSVGSDAGWVDQVVWPAPAAASLTITPSGMEVPATSGQFNIAVESNTSWNVSDNASWLTAAPLSGSGNGTIAVTYLANSATAARNGTITIASSGITRTCTVTQAAATGTGNNDNNNNNNGGGGSSGGGGGGAPTPWCLSALALLLVVRIRRKSK